MILETFITKNLLNLIKEVNMESITYLTYLGVVVLLGLACSVLSKKLKLPNILLLIFTGIFLNKFWDMMNWAGRLLQNLQILELYTDYVSAPLISFPPLFIATLALLALVMIVFESTSRFKYRDLDDFSLSALKLTMTFFFITFVVLSVLTNIIFSLKNLFLATLFAALMAGTSAGAVMTMVKETKNEVIKLLQIESIFNTPLIVIIPFVIVDLMSSIGVVSSSFFISKFMEQLVPFLQQIVTGIGAGVIIGLLAIKILRAQYSQVLSPLALIAAALLTYVLAENIGGNGVLAVTAMGFLFGNVVVKEKGHIQEFSSIFSVFLELMVFVLVGLLIEVPLTFVFISKSLFLFAIFLIVRFISVEISFRDKQYNFKEKLFLSLVVPKGIATAVVAISLIGSKVVGMGIVLDLTLIFMLYSILLASVTVKFSKYFIKLNVVNSGDTIKPARAKSKKKR